MNLACGCKLLTEAFETSWNLNNVTRDGESGRELKIFTTLQ